MNATLQRIKALQGMLSKELQEEKSHHTLGELLLLLEPIEFALAGILFSTPFLQPVPLLGLSTPFGGVLVIFGLLQVFGLGQAALPKRLREHPIETETIRKILFYCEKLLHSLQKIPHWELGRSARFLAHPRALGWHVIFMAAVLALPLPIPFSNSIPAWGIVFSCLAMIESNGLFVALSYVFLVANVFFFGTLVYLIVRILMSEGLSFLFSLEGYQSLTETIKNLF